MSWHLEDPEGPSTDAGEPAQPVNDSPDIHNEEEPQPSLNHTLKYQLLGPSLTKAGQDAVDQQKVPPLQPQKPPFHNIPPRQSLRSLPPPQPGLRDHLRCQ